MIGRMVKRFGIAAIAVPVAAAGARRLSSMMAQRRGPSRVTNLLRRSADAMQGRGRQMKGRRRGLMGARRGMMGPRRGR